MDILSHVNHSTQTEVSCTNCIENISDDVWIEICGQYLTIHDFVMCVRHCCKFFNRLALQDSYYLRIKPQIVEKLGPLIELINSDEMKMFNVSYCKECQKNNPCDVFKDRFYSNYMFDYYSAGICIDYVDNSHNGRQLFEIFREMKQFIQKHKQDLNDALTHSHRDQYFRYAYDDDGRKHRFRVIDLGRYFRTSNKKIWSKEVSNAIHCALPLLLQVCRYDLLQLFKLLLRKVTEVTVNHNTKNDSFEYDAGATVIGVNAGSSSLELYDITTTCGT